MVLITLSMRCVRGRHDGILIANVNEIRSVFRYSSLSLAIPNFLYDELKCVVTTAAAVTIATNRVNLQYKLELIKFNQNCGKTVA